MKCIEIMELVESRDVRGLQKALKHESASVRFWAVYGLRNISELTSDAISSIRIALKDDTDVVKIAAARVLCKLGQEVPCLQILEDNLENQNLIVGLYAALFIEDLDEELIRKILPAIQKATENPYEFTKRTAVRISSKFN